MGENVELRCRAEADQLLDMAYSWRLNGLYIRFDKTPYGLLNYISLFSSNTTLTMHVKILATTLQCITT
jgi:hypothetical protein